MKKSIKRFIMDTATDHLYLSLWIDEEEIEVIYELGNQNHSVTILPKMEEILTKYHLELTEIDEIIVGIGPGSYTGVRIGVSIAKMIGYLNKCRVYEVSSLTLMASSSDKNRIVPMIDARRGNSFIALYEQTNGKLIQIREDQLTNTEDFLSTVESPFETVLSGVPKAEKILGTNLLKEVKDIHELVPNYLQITEAERALKSQ